jgi:hypothetical protein
MYRGTKSGWFASDDAAPEIGAWVTALASGFESGRYAGALDASETLMRRARLQAATLLERHTFLERFRDVVVRSLGQTGAAQGELVGVRHVFAALQQPMLDTVS